LTVHNALDPNLMTATERLTELGEILATGVLRLHAKRSQTDDRGETSLDFPANQRVHGRKRKPR
jgi:hypothetical protein